MSVIDEIKRQMKKKRRKNKPIPTKDLLSTGATLLDLGCSGKPRGGFYKGAYILLVGDSDSGKTFLSLTCLAEAAKNPHFNKYKFIHDNPEGGALMDIGKFFGEEVEHRLIQPPLGTSESVEDFYDNLDELYAAGVPFIDILDSMDALDTEEDLAKFQAKKRAREKGTKETGSYGLSKAKLNSQGLRRALSELPKTGSILIIITQTRANIGFGSQYNPKTRSGGNALKFYARLELWTSIRKELKKRVRGKDRQVGIIARIKVKKNHLIGTKSTIDIPIYNSFGIDNVGSCIDYLIDEGHWKQKGKKKKIITATDLDFEGTQSELITKIEEEDLETELQMTVAEVWNEIRTKSELQRKPRY